MSQLIIMDKNMNFKELEKLTIQWAREKGILEDSDFTKQFSKTIEEVEELAHELELLATGHSDTDIEKIKSETGDVIVTLILMTKFLDIELTDCLEVAYNKISKRKGEMVNGLFVKNGD